MKRLFLFCFAAAVCTAQEPKIFIVTDMEGVGGVNNADEQLLPGQRRYEESRRLLTGEVNAAAVGALEAGASQVVIWDGGPAEGASWKRIGSAIEPDFICRGGASTIPSAEIGRSCRKMARASAQKPAAPSGGHFVSRPFHGT